MGNSALREGTSYIKALNSFLGASSVSKSGSGLGRGLVSTSVIQAEAEQWQPDSPKRLNRTEKQFASK